MAPLPAAAAARPARALARRASPLAAAVVVLSSCGTAWVSRSDSAPRALPRESGCQVEFLQRAPERRYEDLGEMYSYYSRVVPVEEALRGRACELGADAVIVKRDVVVVSGRSAREGKLVAGTAIRYVDGTRPADPHRG